MLANASLLLVGVLLLLAGGEAVVRGATGLARSLGISELVIGLTVVAFCTSAPELAVSLVAAWRGRGEISFGSIVGSNLANIGLVVGVTALIRPLHIQRILIVREIPMMLVGTGVAVVLTSDRWFGREPGRLDRGDGIVLLMLFGVFLFYTLGGLVSPLQHWRRWTARSGSGAAPGPVGRHAALTAVGITGLVAGAHVSVESAVAMASALGVPEVVIGLTVLAVGTSLPELAASVVASLRGHVELATGNVVGSNIFNLLFVAGLTATIHPIPLPASGSTDLWTLMLLSAALLGISVTGRRRLVRSEATGLLVVYFVYLFWRSGFAIAG